MKTLPPNYTSRKLEKYVNEYLLEFFTNIEDNTVVYYGSCGEYYDYLEPLIKELFPLLKLEYIDPKHSLNKYVDSVWTFLVRTPTKLNTKRSDVIPKIPVLFDVKELVMD
jgi:hypothetical protein